MDLESAKLLHYCKSGGSKDNGNNSNNNKNSDTNKNNNIASTSNNRNNYKENDTNNYNRKNDIECSSSISCNSVSSSSSSSSSISSTTISPTKKMFNNISKNNSTSSNSSSQYNNNSNSTINSNKRKRQTTLNDKDNELDNPTQPAKRPQIMPSSSASKSSIISIASSSNCYYNSINNNHSNSQPSSISSSYNGDDLPNEIEIRSCSSECLSTVAEYDIGTPSPDGEQTLVVSPSLSHESSSISSVSHHHLQHDQYNHATTTKWQTGEKTPHTEKYCIKSFAEYEAERRSLTPTPETRPCPLPALSWANSADVWNTMCRKDELAAKERNSSMLEKHPGLQPRMRAILLDWLIEVCEVYKLHRETYYLAVDYLDRYLSTTQTKVQKQHLQLIGITCLFVAAKVEEIYPPKIGEFAYVTDGACQEDDIIKYELQLLMVLNWNISPLSIMGWLGIYMQLNASSRTAATFSTNSKNNLSNNNNNSKGNTELDHHNNNNNNNNKFISNNNNNKKLNNNSSNLFKKVQDKNFINFKDINYNNSKNNNYNNFNNDSAIASTSSANNTTYLTVNDSGISITDGNTDDAFIYPQFSGFEFAQTAQVIDLCTLDLCLSNYSYSVIAAAAISHTFGRETAVRVSGYEWNYIESCAKWMEPFFQIVKEESQYLHLMEQNEQIQTKYGLGHICPNISTDDSHIIQAHTTSMTMFDKALLRREQLQSSILTMIKQESSPAVTGSHILCPDGLLTPPSSSRKSIDDDENIENVPDLINIKSSNIL